jgi:predicted metal-dependent peptidase
MDPRISKAIGEWQAKIPSISWVIETHDLVENTEMVCPFRAGRSIIQYCPGIVKGLTYTELKYYLLAEIFRIIIGHPYDRKPNGCSDEALAIASNLVLADNYDFKPIGLPKAEKYMLESGKSYQYYAHAVEAILRKNKAIGGQNDGNSTSAGVKGGKAGTMKGRGSQKMPFNGNICVAQLSGLWKENDMITATINAVYGDAKERGLTPGDENELVRCSTAPKLNYRKVLAAFRESINIGTPILTRMRPNRRMGFERMGRKCKYKANILVAIDASGSIGSEELREFLASVNTLFKYDIDKVDVMPFDAKLGEIVTFRKARKDLLIKGRGGTDFVPVFEFYDTHPEYTGLIVFTDGCAPAPPPLKSKKKAVWVICTAYEYELFKDSLGKVGICCTWEKQTK